MKEYRISRGWGIFIYISATVMIGFFTWMICLPFIENKEIDLELYVFLWPMFFGMIVIMALGIIETYKGKFVIAEDHIYVVGTFSTKKLYLEEINGFRKIDSYIYIIPLSKEQKTIKISTYYKNQDEIEHWLNAHLIDLNLIDEHIERQEILADENIGEDETERLAFLKKAKRAAKELNILGVIIGFWMYFGEAPNHVGIIASVAMPIICLFVMKYYKGLIKIIDNSRACPSIFIAFIASSTGLCLRALFDYNFYDIDQIWFPTSIILVFYMLVLLYGNKDFSLKKAKDYISIFAISLFVLEFSFGMAVMTNCIYDDSKPEIYQAVVISKRVDSGRINTYYVKLTPWRTQSHVEEIMVNKQVYSSLEPKKPVTIYYRKGLLDIPWFEVK